MDSFSELVSKWPSAIVARTEVGKFTGGVLSGKTLANMASKGEPVPALIRIGNKVAYDARELASWLRGRSSKRAA